MKKFTSILMLFLACVGTAWGQMYAPTQRATTFSAGKQYMIFNTAINGEQDRTGFIFSKNDDTFGLKKQNEPLKFVADSRHVWTITATSTPAQENNPTYEYNIKNVATNKWAGLDNANNNTAVNMYIQPWADSKVQKAGVKSKNDNGSVTENAQIGAQNNVFTISSKLQNAAGDHACWNGNPDSWSKWESAHPYAFYEVKEVRSAQDVQDFNKAMESTMTKEDLIIGGFYIKDATKYSSNAVETKEGSLAELLDGNYETFFHSTWSTAADAPHYLQIDLTSEISQFGFYFKKRKQNDNNRPTVIKISGSNDNTTFDSITTINNGLPTDAGTLDYYSAPIKSTKPYRYIRFTILDTNNHAAETNGHKFFTFSEFYVFSGTDYDNFVTFNEKRNNLRNVFYDASKTSQDFSTAKSEFDAAANSIAKNQLTAYINHIQTVAGTGYVGSISSANFETLKTKQTLADAKAYVAANKIQLVDGGYYRLKNLKDNMFLTAKKDGNSNIMHDNATTAKSAASVLQFVSNGTSGQYTLKLQGLNLGRVTRSANIQLVDDAANKGSFVITGDEFAIHKLQDVSVNDDVAFHHLHVNGGNAVGWEANPGGDASFWYIVPATDIEVALHDGADKNGTTAAYGTAYLPFAVSKATGATMYTGKYENTYIALTDASTTGVAAENAILLKGNARTAKATLTIGNGTAQSTGMTGTLTQIAKPTTGTVLTLGRSKTAPNAVGFYVFDGANLRANSAYIHVTNQAATGLSLVFDGEVTDIESVETADKADNQPLFDLTGRRVMQTVKGGIYIKANGEKYIAR